MNRVIGFLLLQCAALVFAWQKSKAEKRRLEALRSFCKMLQQLHGILEAEASPMPELLQVLRRRCVGEAEAFIDHLSANLCRLGESSFQTLWTQAMLESACALDSGTARELESLGSVLGRYDLMTQLQALEACRDQLCQRLSDAQYRQPQTARLTFGLSLSAAMLLGILLI